MPRRTSAFEQLYQTVLLLASEDATVQERLAHAYRRYLEPIDLAAFPDDVRAKLEKVLTDLKKYAAQGELADLPQNDAITLALRIIVIYDGALR